MTRTRRNGSRLLVAGFFLALPWAALGQHSHMHAGAPPAASGKEVPMAPDARTEVAFPPELREHTLANMRDHLLALQEIQAALGASKLDAAADIAERRLGMSSLPLHGAHEVAKFMPQGMQDMGTAMHRSASRLAVATQDAAATNDNRPAIAALSQLTATCVACHAAYRMK